MNRPKITIGVPVYNGTPAIRECLTALENQSFESYEVLIFDNASTDETGVICREFSERLENFHYFRNAETVCATENFELCLTHARGDYFMWRAHDDLCDQGYLEVLSAALDANPDAWLACTTCTWNDLPAKYSKTFKATNTLGVSQFERLKTQLLECAPLWFYGLYRREPLIPAFAELKDLDAQSIYHCDILYLCTILLKGRIVTTPGAMFTGRRLVAKDVGYDKVSSDDHALAISTYWKILRAARAEWTFGPLHRLIIYVLALRYLDRRVVRLKPHLKRRLRERWTALSGRIRRQPAA